MSWIQTYTGRRFDLLQPRLAEICIEDIAHALSLQCRFAGHLREFYSVAQHSVVVSDLTPPEWALAGLLHDAAEAFLGDITAPLKSVLRVEWSPLEERIMNRIAERFELPRPRAWPDSIHLADRTALAGEARDLLPHPVEWFSRLPPPPLQTITPVAPPIAEALFLRRYRELRAES